MLTWHPLQSYFTAIDELKTYFLDQGLDLNRTMYAEDFIRGVQRDYFEPMAERYGSEAMEEQTHSWPRILWFQELQIVLEYEKLSLVQSLINGWELFMDPEAFPAQYLGMKEYALGWYELDAAKQTEFLDVFKIDADMLQQFASGTNTSKLGEISLEMSACNNGFMEQKLLLDEVYPKLSNPRNRPGKCGLCDGQLLSEEVGTTKEHRLVELMCRHAFGHSCIVERFKDIKGWYCEVCQLDLRYTQLHPAKPDEVLASCDRFLKWRDAPMSLSVLGEPHTHLNKLALIFELSNDIRKHLLAWLPDPEGTYVDCHKVNNLMLYLARERLKTVMQGDVLRYREVIAKQVQAAARRAWFGFLARCHPDAPMGC